MSQNTHQKLQPLSTKLGKLLGREGRGQPPQDARQTVHLLLGHSSTAQVKEEKKGVKMHEERERRKGLKTNRRESKDVYIG